MFNSPPPIFGFLTVSQSNKASVNPDKNQIVIMPFQIFLPEVFFTVSNSLIQNLLRILFKSDLETQYHFFFRKPSFHTAFSKHSQNNQRMDRLKSHA